MNWLAIILFLVIGATLMALELVALPGGIAGIAGAAMMVIGVWQAYASYGVVAGNVTLLVTVLVMTVLIVIFLRRKTWKKAGLNAEISGKVNVVDEDKIIVGAQGKTISRLAPAGKAMVNGQMVEVHTLGEFVDENREIEVVSIEGYYITVKEIKQNKT